MYNSLFNTLDPNQDPTKLAWFEVSYRESEDIVNALQHYGFSIRPENLDHAKSPSYTLELEGNDLRITFHPGTCSFVHRAGTWDEPGVNKYFNTLEMWWDEATFNYYLSFKDGNKLVLSV